MSKHHNIRLFKTAQNVQWDVLPRKTGITDGPGILDSATYNLTDDSGFHQIPTSTGMTLRLGGGSFGAAGTISVGTGVSLAGLTSDVPNGNGIYTLSGGSFAVQNNANIPFVINQGLNISTSFTGTGVTLTKTGNGTLALQQSASNSLPANFVVNSGALDGTTVNYMRSMFADNVGNITVNAGATLKISDAHAFGGAPGFNAGPNITLNSATLNPVREQYFKSLTLNGSTILSSNHPLRFLQNAVTVVGTQASTVASGFDTYSTPMVFNVGVTGDPQGDLLITGGGLKNVNSTAINVTKQGLGKMVLSGGAYPLTGIYTVSAGTMDFKSTTPPLVAGKNWVVSSGATLLFESATAVNLTGTNTGAGNIQIVNGGHLQYNGVDVNAVGFTKPSGFTGNYISPSVVSAVTGNPVTIASNRTSDRTFTVNDNYQNISTVSITGNPSHGVASLSTSTAGGLKTVTVSYTPTTGYVGSDSLTVTVNDGRGVSTNQLFQYNDVANSAPVINNNGAVVDVTYGSQAQFTIAASDPEGDTLSYVIDSISGGTATIVGNSITYTPTTNTNHTDSIQFSVTDQYGATTIGTVSFNVLAQAASSNVKRFIRISYYPAFADVTKRPVVAFTNPPAGLDVVYPTSGYACLVSWDKTAVVTGDITITGPGDDPSYILVAAVDGNYNPRFGAGNIILNNGTQRTELVIYSGLNNNVYPVLEVENIQAPDLDLVADVVRVYDYRYSLSKNVQVGNVFAKTVFASAAYDLIDTEVSFKSISLTKSSNGFTSLYANAGTQSKFTTYDHKLKVLNGVAFDSTGTNSVTVGAGKHGSLVMDFATTVSGPMSTTNFGYAEIQIAYGATGVSIVN